MSQNACVPPRASAPIPQVVLKLRDNLALPDEDGMQEQIERLRIGPWDVLRERFPGITLQRLYTSLTPRQIKRLVDRGVERDPTYHPPDFLTYFAVEVPPAVDAEALAKTLETCSSVQFAYADGRPGPPPVVDMANDPHTHASRGYPAPQGYLDPAPVGIDARFARAHVDSCGTKVPIGFVDLEQGWALNHMGLAAAAVTLISGTNHDHFDHGTSVLGIVVAMDNTSGTVGVAPHARARVISEWRPTGKYNRADAVMAAVAEMNSGEVLLLETQFWPVDGGLPWPCEARAAVFDSIRLGTALGIVMVEPAGNGSLDLDTCSDAHERRLLNRLSPDFQDSGAIMVGAAQSTIPHARLGASSFGSRIDCYAWGDSVVTLTSDPTGAAVDRYTSSFGGTSGSAAIVAGAALIVQSMAEARLGHRFSPGQLRTLLSSPANGTASRDPAVDRIGVMPDLRKILQNEFGICTPVVE